MNGNNIKIKVKGLEEPIWTRWTAATQQGLQQEQHCGLRHDRHFRNDSRIRLSRKVSSPRLFFHSPRSRDQQPLPQQVRPKPRLPLLPQPASQNKGKPGTPTKCVCAGLEGQAKLRTQLSSLNPNGRNKPVGGRRNGVPKFPPPSK